MTEPLLPIQADFCLLIPCYNNYMGLVRSLQTVHYPGPCLILVVDDGSEKEIHQTQIQHDIGMEQAVRVIRMERNVGITGALNQGLEWIFENVNTAFVARLDCGDTCNETRFTCQVRMMQDDPGLVLTGTWCYFRDPSTRKQYPYITPLQHEAIEREMYNRNVFIHPTVMFRSDAVKTAGLYPGGFELAEDYALFWTLMKLGKSAVINHFMVTCEIRKDGLSYINKGKQLAARWKVIRSFGKSPRRKLGAYLRLSGLFILPKGLILWLKHKKA